MEKKLFLVTTSQGSFLTISDSEENAKAKVAASKGGDVTAFIVRPVCEFESVE